MHKRLLTFALSSLAVLGAHAADIGQHPAVFAPRGLPGIEADRFIVGHPAGGWSMGGHANHPHPALATSRQAPHVDTDHFLVQPPATTRWNSKG